MFLFVARDRKQARVLHWDGTGLVILAKRLERGRFNAPWEGHRDKPWCLSPSELALFLEGSRLVGHYEVSPPSVTLARR
jgi:transposase